MKAGVEALARHRLFRAPEALAEGEHLLAKWALTGAINRFYYGAFYAARSLLDARTRLFPAEWRHFAVAAALCQDRSCRCGKREGASALVREAR